MINCVKKWFIKLLKDSKDQVTASLFFANVLLSYVAIKLRDVYYKLHL